MRHRHWLTPHPQPCWVSPETDAEGVAQHSGGWRGSPACAVRDSLGRVPGPKQEAGRGVHTCCSSGHPPSPASGTVSFSGPGSLWAVLSASCHRTRLFPAAPAPTLILGWSCLQNGRGLGSGSTDPQQIGKMQNPPWGRGLWA